MSDAGYVTKAQAQAMIRRRVRAVDRALSAMLTVLNEELADDPRGLESMRELVTGLRTTLLARHPFASDVIGGA